MRDDLILAWKRICNDYSKKKQFVKPAGLIDALDSNLDKWLSKIQEKIINKAIIPSPIQIVDIPKGNGLIRPGSIIDLDDLMVYFYCLGNFLPNIFKEVEWSQKIVDFGYTINGDNLHTGRWIEDGITGWEIFGKKSMEHIQSDDYQYMIVTDITGFYENIDIATLISDLKSVGCNSELVGVLSSLLNRWCQITGRGLPQNNSASDILAKFYFDTIDKSLSNKGITHLRYVDDIRIFCKTIEEAKNALIILSKLCRIRGLNLQSAKTKILESAEAEGLVLGVQPLIDKYYSEAKIEIDFTTQLIEEYSNASEDFTEELDPSKEQKDYDILARIYSETFLKPDSFNKTLFRFTVNKLIRFKNFDFVENSIDLLIEYPQETDQILKYLRGCGKEEKGKKAYRVGLRKLMLLLIDNKFIYDFQRYQIILFFKTENFFRTELLGFCRDIAENLNTPNYLRIICMIYLGINGDKADISLIESFVLSSTNNFEKAEALIAIRNMEITKRKTICGRVKRDHIFIELMAEYMKND